MSEDVVRQVKIVATGENIDSTTASVKQLGNASDNTGKSAQAQSLYWIDLNAKLDLAQKAYGVVSSAATGAAKSVDDVSAAVGRLNSSVSNGASNNELTVLWAKVNSIWQEGIDKLDSLVKLSDKAGNLSVEYYQRLTKAATDAKQPADAYLKIIENINKALDRQLGSNGLQNGSTFNAAVVELQKNGNLQGQTADVNRLNNSVTGQEQLNAALELIKGATEAGEKLVAFKLAGTLMGPEAAANLKADNDYIYQIEQSIKNVQDKDIVKQTDVDRAVAMKTEMDNAKKIIDSWFSPKATSDWSTLGISFQQLWLNANQNFAATLSWLDKILTKTQEIANVKPSNPETSIWTKLGDYFGGQSASGITRLDDAGRQLEVAKQSLGGQLSNSNNVANARRDLQKADDWRTPDQSSPPPAAPEAAKKAQEEYNDAVDRAINSLTKHVEMQKADAAAVGQGAAALAGLRVDAAELAAVQANGGKETDAQADAFGDLKDEAEAAALALAKAKVASELKRENQLLFASAEDVKIANQLKDIYGDNIPAALGSSEAAAIRFTDTLKTAVDDTKRLGGAFANDLVSGIMSGKSAMDSLTSAASSLGKSLTTAGINNIIKDPTSLTGYVETGIGVITSWFTGNSEKKKAEEAAAAAAAAAAAKAVQAGLDRSAKFNAEANTASIDTSTVAGQIAAFDIQAQQKRADEAKAGNQAIVALENDLAKQRQAIVDKANAAIAKSMNDFLNSIKTGASSILSPEDQLAYAQSKFNTDVTAGQGGNEAALNSVTADAQNLLDIAKGFYASGTGYATVYQSVTDAITGLANHTNITVGADAGVTQATAAVVDTSSSFGVKGYAGGGEVTNGTYGVDSVMAKLAGGEHITRSSSVNGSTRGALDYINRTGKAPGDSAEVVRVLTQGFNGQTQVLSDKLDAIADRIAKLENTTRQTNNQRRVPGTNQKAA